MTRASEEARLLWPYLLPMVQRVATSGGSTGGGLTPAGLTTAQLLASIDTARGLAVVASKIRVNLNTTGGLEFGAGGVLQVNLHPNKYGLVADVDGLYLSDNLGGNGLTMTPITQALNIGTPSSTSVTSTNTVGADTHNHAVIADDDVGTLPAAALLKSTAAGGLTLASLAIKGNLAFTGGDRTITASSDLTLTPVDDLILTSTKTFRSSDYADGIPIAGFSLHINSIANRQLTINSIKADELHVRLFVADMVRVDVGEEYWGKSMGIVYADFVTPSAIAGTVTMLVEDSPAFSGALFSSGDWVLIRIIDDSGGGLVVASIWGQVSSYASLGEDAEGRKRQSWTFTLRQGPVNQPIKAGNVIVDFGASGQGYVHLSTLASADGPWIQIGTWAGANPYTAGNRTIRAQMGKLDNISDTALNPSGYGFYSDNAYMHGMLRTAETIMDDDGLSLLMPDVADGYYPSTHAFMGWWFDLDDRTGFALASLAAWRNVGTVGAEYNMLALNVRDDGAIFSNLSLVATGTQSVSIGLDSRGVISVGGFTRISGDVEPSIDNWYDFGSASKRWKTIYADELIISGAISGATIGGAEWQHSGSMVIDANDAASTTVSIVNQGAGRADLDVDRNITLGGTIDGVDLSVFNSAYTTHAADANAHHNQVHVLASGTALGADHTISGAAAGQVLRALSATTAAFDVLQHGDLGGVTANDHHNQAHVLATGTALGADHTISGAAVGEVLRALSATTAAFDVLQHSDLGSITANQHHNQIHSITGSDHTITGSQYQLVGATATNTLGLLTPSADVGTTPAEAILKSTSAGGLILGTLNVKGSVTVTNGGDFTVGANVLFVDEDGGGIGNVGILRAPDGQFALDVNGAIRGTELIGKHAIQLDDVALLLHFDGGHPYETNFTGEINALPMGKVPTTAQNVIFRPGKFYKNAVFGGTRTNLVTNPSFEVNTTGYTVTGSMSVTRVTDDFYVGANSGKLTWTLSAAANVYCVPVASSSIATYSFSVWLRAAVPVSVALYIRRDTTPFTVYGTKTINVTEEWQVFSISAAVGTASIPLRGGIETTSAANTMWLDGVQFEQAATPSWYIDGTLGEDYTWTGSAHASTSNRTQNVLLRYDLFDMVVHRWSVMGWFAWPFETPPNNNGMFSIAMRSGSEVFEVFANSTGIIAGTDGGSGFVYNTIDSGPFVAGQYYHVAATYTPGTLSFFLNGELVTTRAITFDYEPTVAYLGSMAGPANPGDVMIDDFCISRQCLTNARVRAIYESDAPVFATSNTFMFRATATGLVWADEEGLWMLDVNGEAVLGAYGGEAATKTWGNIALSKGDILFGRYGVSKGGWLIFDRDGVSSQPFLALGYETTTILALDAGGASLTGVLDISTSGGIYQGSGTFASPTTGMKIYNNSGVGVMAGYNAGVAQWYVHSDGRLYAGGGNVRLDATGTKIIASTSGFNNLNSYTLTDASYNVVSGLKGVYTATENIVGVIANEVASRDSSIQVNAFSPTAKISVVTLNALVNNVSAASLILTSSGAKVLIEPRAEIAQTSAVSGVPTLVLSQADLSEPFIQFVGTVSAGNPINQTALGSYYGRVRVAVNGTYLWLALYN